MYKQFLLGIKNNLIAGVAELARRSARSNRMTHGEKLFLSFGRRTAWKASEAQIAGGNEPNGRLTSPESPMQVRILPPAPFLISRRRRI